VEDNDYQDVLGTNRNAPSAGEGQPTGFNLVNNAKQKMGDRAALPKLLVQKPNVCHYNWAKIRAPPTYTVFRNESLSVDDVSQGGVGDCGLGASVIAITASKRTNYLRRLTSEWSQFIVPYSFLAGCINWSAPCPMPLKSGSVPSLTLSRNRQRQSQPADISIPLSPAR